MTAKLIRVGLLAPRDRLTELDAFYRGTLGVPAAPEGYRVGASRLVFGPAEGSPFYHFALLVPGDRFEAARAWAEQRVALLPAAAGGEPVTYFAHWDAHACYFHDPARNIVELIAHHGVGESGATGGFDAAELLQVSEIGLVGDLPTMASNLADLGLELTQGSVEAPDGLAFLGPPTSSVILSGLGRGWLPQGRPAEPHPVELLLESSRPGEVLTQGHRVRTVSRLRS